MTSRERILHTARGLPTDRVPISLYELSPIPGSHYASFANRQPSYARLLGEMLEKTDTMFLTKPNIRSPKIEALTETTQWREGPSLFTKTVLHTPKGDLQKLTRDDDGIFTTWTLEHFLKEEEDIEKYCALPFESTVDNTPLLLADQAVGQHGIICPSLGDPVARASDLFAMEDFSVIALVNPALAEEFLDFLWETCVKKELQAMLQCGIADCMYRIVGPEYMTPPYMPPRFFARYVTQYLQQAVGMIHEKGAISRVHSHGKVRHALGEFAKTGVMCVDPLEPLPDGDISLQEVKQLYPNQFTLLGNIELKHLERMEPDEIERMVREVLQDGMPGGRFILMPTASPINIPLAAKTEENLLRMIEAGHRYGRYS